MQKKVSWKSVIFIGIAYAIAYAINAIGNAIQSLFSHIPVVGSALGVVFSGIFHLIGLLRYPLGLVLVVLLIINLIKIVSALIKKKKMQKQQTAMENAALNQQISNSAAHAGQQNVATHGALPTRIDF